MTTFQSSKIQITYHLICIFSILHQTTAWSIGANYGTVADNLPPPAKVAEFLKTKTAINRIKLFDANPDIIKGFSNTDIPLSITVPNGDIPTITQLPAAQQWVATHVTPFVGKTKIVRVLVGNEILHWGPQNLIDNLVPAMRTLHQALQQAGHVNIQVSTPHSLAILERTDIPSTGHFRPEWDISIFTPMLQFLKETNSPFIVNPYPYFDVNPQDLNFYIFGKNQGRVDPITKHIYTSQFDFLMDSVFSAMKALGFADVDIVAGETGWPAIGEPFQTWVSPELAQAYNSRLVMHVNSGKGTPLMPKRKFETYIFGLFTENLKPGPVAERNFGLFRPDFTPVYDIGVMRNGPDQPQPKPLPQSQPKPQPLPTQPQPQPQPIVNSGKQWCVPKPEATDAQLQSNVDYACGQVDCKLIQAGGACFEPNNIRSHATYAMNSYYQTKGRQISLCDFANTGVLTNKDPSYGACAYPS